MNAPTLTPYLFLASKLPNPELNLYVFLPHPRGKSFAYDGYHYDERGNIEVDFSLVEAPGSEAEYFNCRVEIKYPPYTKASVLDGKKVMVRVRSEMEVPGVDWSSKMSIPFYRGDSSEFMEYEELAINKPYFYFEDAASSLELPSPALFIPCTAKVYRKIHARQIPGLPVDPRGQENLINLKADRKLIIDLMLLLKEEEGHLEREDEQIYFVHLTASKEKRFSGQQTFAPC
ncbi:MAG: hypothetical protein KDC44_06570 [Phaeodactylibacter sp.]|nr:hypothetical protein [Phaeodactylibacter sp.]